MGRFEAVGDVLRRKPVDLAGVDWDRLGAEGSRQGRPPGKAREAVAPDGTGAELVERARTRQGREPSTGSRSARPNTTRMPDGEGKNKRRLVTKPAAVVTPVYTPCYACDVCHDTGWLRTFVGPEEWKHELVRCKCQREADAVRAWERARAASDLLDDQADMTFDGYDAQYNAGALELVRTWAADPASESVAPWVVLWGPLGTGKSHLLAAAFNALVHAGKHPIYAVVPLLLDHIRGGIETGDYGERFEALMKCPVLILDDLGSETRTRWTDEALFKLLDWRYRNALARKTPTLIASNLMPDDWEARIGSRAQDRLRSRVIEMVGPDMRKVSVKSSVKARAAR